MAINYELAIVGGLLVVGVAYVVVKQSDGSSSSGIAFSTAPAASVAAVAGMESADAATAATARTNQDSLATSLLGLQLTTNAQTAQSANTNATSLAVTQTNDAGALAQVQTQANEADTVANYNYKTAINAADQATAQTKIAGSTILGTTKLTTASDQAIAKTQSAAQVTTAQAQAGAQKTSSIWGSLGNIVSAVTSVFTKK